MKASPVRQLDMALLASLCSSKFLFVLPIISIKDYFQGWLETESGPGGTVTGENVCWKKHGQSLRAKAISLQNWPVFLPFLLFLSEPAKPFSRKWQRADSGLQFPCLCQMDVLGQEPCHHALCCAGHSGLWAWLSIHHSRVLLCRGWGHLWGHLFPGL